MTLSRVFSRANRRIFSAFAALCAIACFGGVAAQAQQSKTVFRDARSLNLFDDVVDDAESPVPTKLSFEVDRPGTVTLERRGFLQTMMIFEAKRRHRALYKTPFGGFEMTVYSRKVDNALCAEGGKLTLDYAVEFRGAAEQKVKLTLEATRL